jgi:excisionase family DNA binding protein
MDRHVQLRVFEDGTHMQTATTEINSNNRKEKLLLTPYEVADQLSISRAKVYAMAASGELAAVRMGRSIRIPAAAVSSFLTSHAA